MEELWYWHWLCSMEEISSRKKIRLLQWCHTPEALYNIEEKEIFSLGILTLKEQKRFSEGKHRTESFLETYEWMKKRQIRLVTLADPDYPSRLLQIDSPPCGLYVRGSLPPETKKAVAIVGARNCTNYGREMAKRAGKVLASEDIAVISGLALGIDGAAHRGALETGTTYGILGCGLDICFPREHIGLYGEILKYGGLVSEYPPGSKPLSWHFPWRNRLISGLSDLVLVMEAREKSGSLITAGYAADQGKDVLALPGLVTNPLSQGCHQLIASGAGIFTGPESALEILRPGGNHSLKISKEMEMGLVPDEKKVYSCLDFVPKNLDEIIIASGLEAKKAAQVLVRLEMKGLLQRTEGNHYALKTR